MLQGILLWYIAAAQAFKTCSRHYHSRLQVAFVVVVGIYILPNTYPIFHFANR